MPRSKRKSLDQNFEIFLNTNHLKNDLKQRSIRGGFLTIGVQACKFILTLISNIALARLLTPEDYGLVGMVTAVTGFVTLFKDLGLSMATIQKSEISHQQVSSLFWINVVFGVGAAIAIAGLAPFIAQFYREPQLVWITIALAVGIAISALGVQHDALLKRQMLYGAIVTNDLVSQFLGILMALLTAFKGFGYWALVVYPLVTIITSSIGSWILCGWRPGLPNWQGIRPMLEFGSHLTGFSIINYFSRNLDNVLIGKVWGAQQLGIYTKAYQLLLLPLNQINTPISNIAIPLLSRLTDTPDQYRQVYLKILEKLMFITMPIVVFMISSSDWLIELLLGSQWIEAKDIFFWLGIAGLMQPITSSIGWLFISQGKTDSMFKWSIIGGTLNISSILIGLSWGANGVAMSYAAMWCFINMPLLYWYAGKITPIKTKDFYITAAPMVLSSLFSYLVVLALKTQIEINNPFTGCLLGFFATIITFLGCLYSIPKGRLIIFDIKEMIFEKLFA